MKFSKEAMEKLKKCMEDNTLIKITGKNGAGQPYETKGIMEFIGEDELTLFLGQYTKEGYKNDERFFSGKGLGIIDHLYIGKIEDKNGSEIFVNKDLNNIIEELRNENIDKSWAPGYLKDPLSRFGQKYLKYIGKPIIISEFWKKEKGILRAVSMLDQGMVCFDITDGIVERGIAVEETGDKHISLDTDTEPNLMNYKSCQFMLDGKLHNKKELGKGK